MWLDSALPAKHEMIDLWTPTPTTSADSTACTSTLPANRSKICETPLQNPESGMQQHPKECSVWAEYCIIAGGLAVS
jgi:hypothetical protein